MKLQQLKKNPIYIRWCNFAAQYKISPYDAETTTRNYANQYMTLQPKPVIYEIKFNNLQPPPTVNVACDVIFDEFSTDDKSSDSQV